MGKFIDLTGEKIGSLTVIKKCTKTNNGKTGWLCRCDCGNVKIIPTTLITHKKLKSCGCLRKKDLTGKKFSRLTVIKECGITKNQQSIWLCKCDCGNIKEIMYCNLTTGSTKSCGCLRSEQKWKNRKEYQRLSLIFNGMKYRCYNSNSPAYKNYGGRGIKICDEWIETKGNGFRNFYNWAIQNGYKEDLSIDRIDVNGNYEPSNCRWATAKEQANNKRLNCNIEYYGKKYTLKQLSEKLGIKVTTLKWRLDHNWEEKDLSLEVNLANKYVRKGMV